jgi:hypothetical protein
LAKANIEEKRKQVAELREKLEISKKKNKERELNFRYEIFRCRMITNFN